MLKQGAEYISEKMKIFLYLQGPLNHLATDGPLMGLLWCDLRSDRSDWLSHDWKSPACKWWLVTVCEPPFTVLMHAHMWLLCVKARLPRARIFASTRRREIKWIKIGKWRHTACFIFCLDSPAVERCLERHCKLWKHLEMCKNSYCKFKYKENPQQHECKVTLQAR